MKEMIYFDNSATTLKKPKEVAEAVCYAIGHFGNAGRSFYSSAMHAGREIYQTRCEIAALTSLKDPLHVAFTSSATESLNLVIGGLVGPEDSVITTVLEHNSVLRPLYNAGCELIFMDCDGRGDLDIGSFAKIMKPNTKFLVCTHGSNVLGNITDARRLYETCRQYAVTMVLDVSQTLGSIETRADMADILCFTGHKALFGPQGTGGIIAANNLPFRILKTGGAGTNSFAPLQLNEMPDVFEAGTLNSHGIYGLQKGVQFVNHVGVNKIHAKETALARHFYEGVSKIPGITVYGNPDADRLPILSLNMQGLNSEELALKLWEQDRIAVRAGSHCAPLLHKRFGTMLSGMARFSFSYFNTPQEIEEGLSALRKIAESL